ncbi:hypothetical protein DFS34DRAFT_585035 [Phlyctochytrium arcticum]|nr:hypothetical protein DFS34DRAFT_585035 [Phlyctochytrium arcticum]
MPPLTARARPLSREKFVPHAVPPFHQVRRCRLTICINGDAQVGHQAKRVEYAKNNAPFDGTTTQKHDYPAWPVGSAPSMRPKAAYVENQAKFDGQTTTRRDFGPVELPPRAFRKQPEYTKSGTVFEGTTTHNADYKAWDVPSHSRVRKIADYVSPKEDREFKSTTATAYIGHPMTRTQGMMPREAYVTSSAKFDGVTTTQDSFRHWDLPEKAPKHKAAYVPSGAHFQDETTYRDNYQPKAVERTLHVAPKYQAVTTKFEGTSTHRTDFQSPGRTAREPDFSPRAAYNPQHDDRDWGTTMRSQYTPKPIPRCPAVSWIPLERERHSDGHVYLAPGQRPELAA